MELVYLWIEEYKNIKQQGFNLNPKFNCYFNKEKKELVIDERDNYKSIFPENINITAIVGENGSGKSNILKLLKKILDYIPYTELGYGYSDNMTYPPFDFILVLNIDNKQQYISNIEINGSSKKLDTAIQYNYYLYLADNQRPENEELRTDEIQQHKFSIDANIIAQMLTSTYISEINFELTTFMYLPEKIEIKPLDLYHKFSQLTSIYEQGHGVSVELDGNMTDKQEDKAYRDAKYQGWAKKDDLDGIFNEADDFHKFLIIWYIQEYGDENYYEFEKKDFLLSEYNYSNGHLSESDFSKYFIEDTKNIKTFTGIEKSIYFKHYSDFFEFDFIDSKNRKFNNLSHGEQTIFSQFLNIYFFSIFERQKVLLFLMDEPDLSLHPQWQKSYISELVNLLKKLNVLYNILITSHSPFILSDLPKENIVFLEDAKQVTVDIESFGANIHTLLSHGFFMKDGLMGKFAKEKIDELLEYLNGNLETSIKNNDEAQYRINMVGEPVLRKQLQKMLNEKKFFKKDRINLIEEQIKELSNELEQLKK